MTHVINNVLIGLNNIGSVFCNYAAGVFVQSALLVILLLVVDLLLRKRVRAVFRYCVWLLILVKLVLPPTLSLPTGIGYWVGDHLPAASSISDRAFDVARLERASASAEMPQFRPARDLPDNDSSIMLADSALTPLTWQAVLFILWLVGVFAFLVVLVQRVRFVRGLIAVSSPAKKELLDLLEQCRRKICVRWDIRLRISDTIPSPAVCGFFRPTVLIPALLVEKLSPDGLRAILIHELAHIKRGDLWVNSFQTFLQIIYFYNPFVWFANAVIRRVCEEAVDETVLVTLGGQAKNYSNTLIDIGEMAFWRADLGLRLIGVAESKKALQWRIRHMLNRPIPKSSKLGALGIIVILTIAAVLLPMAKAEKSVGDNKPVATENEGKLAQSLQQAAADGDIEQVKKLIAQGADVNASEGDKPWTPLLAAACAGQTQVVKLLLENGAKVDAVDANRFTPLLYAMWCDDEEAVRLLISHGADVNRRVSEENEYTPIFYANWQGHAGIVKALIDVGADVNAKGLEGWTILHYVILETKADVSKQFIGTGVNIPDLQNAVLKGDVSKVRQLVESGMDVDTPDKLGWTPAYWASSVGQKEVFEYLLSQGADVTTFKTEALGRTLLLQASRGGFLEIVKQLIDKGADVNAAAVDGCHPLGDAALNGHEDVVKLLLASGAKVNLSVKGRGTALQAAAVGGNSAIFDLLISNGADVNAESDYGTPLHLAAGQSVEIVKMLLSRGVDVNVKESRWGRTPVYEAAGKRNYKTAEVLIAHGADVHVKETRYGRTPLHEAVRRGGPVRRGGYKVAEVLLSAGADVNAKDNNGHTPLWYAKKGCIDRTKIVELLRKHGAKAEKPNEDKKPVATENERKPTKSLHQAAKDGDLEQVKKLIAQGADVNAMNNQGRTPLHLAAFHGHREVAALLIARGADVNSDEGDEPWTPLLDAACTGQTQVVKLLLQHEAKVDAADAGGYTPLFYAIWSEDEEGVKALISAGADVNKRPSKEDEAGWTPLCFAVWQGHKGIVKAVIDGGANVNKEDEDGWTPLHYAIKQTNADVAKQFIGTGVKIPDFHNAILEGNLAKVKQLVESGMDVDTKDKFGCTPAYWALSAGQIELFEYLLNKGANVRVKTNKGRTLLQQASQGGFAEMVKLLIAKGADVNAAADDGTHPLGDAAGYGHEEVVKLLLANGANINLSVKGKGTALHAAAWHGYSTIVDFLITKGADVNVNATNGTPLHLAAGASIKVGDKRCAEIVEKLLAHGADVYAKESRWSRTPLHEAARKGRTQTTEILIAAGAYVSAKNNEGRTPLHDAARRGQHKAAEVLIAAGADANAKDNEGHTPLWHANDRGHSDVAELLRKHGVKAEKPNEDMQVLKDQKADPSEISGIVIDQQGKTIEGVFVDVWSWYSGNETYTDKNGFFQLKGFGPDQKTVEIRFSKDKYSPRYILKQPLGLKNTQVVLDDKTYFEGKVIDSNSKPVPNALIRAIAGPKRAEGVTISEVPTEITSRDDGSYRLYVQADVYDIQVKVEQGVIRLPKVNISKNEAKQLDLKLSDSVTFLAKVVDKQTAQPVEGFRLYRWKHPGVDGTSDSNGLIEITGMLPGKFNFQVEAKQCGRWWSGQSVSQWNHYRIDDKGTGWQRNFDRLDFNLTVDMEPVTIFTEKPVRITGKVLDPDGNAVAGATATLARTGSGNSITGDTRYSFATDENGSFEMIVPASKEAEYNLLAHDGKYNEWRKWANGVLQPIKTNPGDIINDIVIELGKTASVKGKVLDSSGNPVPNHKVRSHAFDKLGNRYYDPTTRTDENGNFEIKFIRPGKHYVQAYPFWLTAEQAPEKTSKIIKLEPGETIYEVELVAVGQ